MLEWEDISEGKCRIEDREFVEKSEAGNFDVHSPRTIGTLTRLLYDEL